MSDLPVPETATFPDEVIDAGLRAMWKHARSHDQDDYTTGCCIEAALAAAAPFIAAEAAAAERARLLPLIRAMYRLYEVIWNETGTMDGGPDGYNLLSYDDTNAIDEAASAVEALVTGDIDVADLIGGQP